MWWKSILHFRSSLLLHAWANLSKNWLRKISYFCDSYILDYRFSMIVNYHSKTITCACKLYDSSERTSTLKKILICWLHNFCPKCIAVKYYNIKAFFPTLLFLFKLFLYWKKKKLKLFSRGGFVHSPFQGCSFAWQEELNDTRTTSKKGYCCQDSFTSVFQGEGISWLACACMGPHYHHSGSNYIVDDNEKKNAILFDNWAFLPWSFSMPWLKYAWK